jgi:hypothetical protein
MSMMQNQLGQATSQGLGAMEKMGSGAEAFGGLAQLYGNQMQQGQNIALNNAEYKDRKPTAVHGSIGRIR